ncbi:MAG: MFS transporter [Methanocorpusculum sp.]|nr:MFS transporter [Methanocorpusculum sp.]
MSVIEERHLQILFLISVASAMLMDTIDGSIVNIILPVIANDFSTDTGTVSWVIITYLLVVAGLVLIIGKLADGAHIKKFFLTGFAVFTIGSALCGTSPTLEFLLFARVIQGLGAAFIIACGPLLCVKFLPSKMLGFSFAVLTAAGSIGFALGPAVGGIITEFFSWHWIFLINIPIGIASFIFAMKVIPKAEKCEREPFDIIGSVLIFVAMACGIFCIERLPHLGISNTQIIAVGSVTIAAAVLFVIRELRCKYPVFNIRVFKIWQVTSVYLAFFIIQIICCGILYLMPFYLTAGLGMNSLTAGFFMFITPVIVGIISIPIGKWSDKKGRRWFMAAASLAALIQTLIYVFIVPEWSIFVLVISFVLWSLSLGLSGGPGGSRIVEWMPEGERALGSSLMVTCIYFGGVVGTALFACLFTVLTSAGGVVSFTELDYDIFMSGFHGSMIFAVILAAVSLILSTIVKDRR